MDMALACLRQVPSFEHLALVAPALFATALTVAVVFVALWSLVMRPLALHLGWQASATRFALACAMGTFFVLLRIAELPVAAVSAAQLFNLGLFTALGGVVGVTAYFATLAVDGRSSSARLLGALLLASPAVLFELLAYLWVQIYHIDAVASASGISALVALLGALATTLWLARRSSAVALRLTVTLTVLAALISLGAYLQPRLAVRTSDAGRSEHAVRHVLLITSDAMRADMFGAYGNTRIKTPAIDGLASDGVVFENGTSVAPWTLPSLSTLMSGVSPAVHLVRLENGRLPRHLTTLAEHFAAAGYFTGAIVDNPFLRRQVQLDQGFIDYRFLEAPSYGNVVGALVMRHVLPSLFRPARAWTIDEQMAMVRDWVQRNAERDFFLWVHIFDPHAPYQPRPELVEGQPPEGMSYEFSPPNAAMSGYMARTQTDQDWIRKLYEGEVRAVDAEVGKLLEQLRVLNLYDEALIAFTSDHGEEFWEHNANGHGHTLYNELLHVPLILKLPNNTLRSRVAPRVSSERVVATLLEAADVEYDAARLAPSLMSLVRDGTTVTPPVVSLTIIGTEQDFIVDNMETVFADEKKYIRSLITGREQIYDLRNDPTEQHSLVGSSAAVAANAAKLLKDYGHASQVLRERNDISSDETVAIDSGTLHRLRGLGYIQ